MYRGMQYVKGVYRSMQNVVCQGDVLEGIRYVKLVHDKVMYYSVDGCTIRRGMHAMRGCIVPKVRTLEACNMPKGCMMGVHNT